MSGRGLCEAEGCVEPKAARVQYCERHKALRLAAGQRAFNEREARRKRRKRRKRPVTAELDAFESALDRGDFAGALLHVAKLDELARASGAELERLVYDLTGRGGVR